MKEDCYYYYYYFYFYFYFYYYYYYFNYLCMKQFTNYYSLVACSLSFFAALLLYQFITQ